jgi:hypothetical protein
MQYSLVKFFNFNFFEKNINRPSKKLFLYLDPTPYAIVDDAQYGLKGAKCSGALDPSPRATSAGRAPTPLAPLYYSRASSRVVPFLSIPVQRQPFLLPPFVFLLP